MADKSWNAKKLIQSVRKRAFEQKNGLYVPRTEGDRKTNWPVCMTCKRDVDSVNVEDIGNDTVTIRARCHDKEAIIKMEFPFRITQRKDEETWHHVMTAVNNATFFDPSVA